jgi:hypothetical protein
MGTMQHIKAFGQKQINACAISKMMSFQLKRSLVWSILLERKQQRETQWIIFFNMTWQRLLE